MVNNTENNAIDNTKSEKNPTLKKQENILLSTGVNILAPVLILKNGGDWSGLSAAYVLSIALAFPVIYFIYDLRTRKKYNFIAILGFVSVLLTGGIGLLELPRIWFIIKEGTIPLLIGCAVVGSLKTRYPLVKTFLYSDLIIQVDKIDALLLENGKQAQFEKLMVFCTWLIASSFLFSAVVQYILASVIVTAEPSVDKELFNQQVGDMTWISFLVIMVPSFLIMSVALWRMFSGIQRLTGLKMEEVFMNMPEERS